MVAHTVNMRLDLFKKKVIVINLLIEYKIDVRLLKYY